MVSWSLYKYKSWNILGWCNLWADSGLTAVGNDKDSVRLVLDLIMINYK